jgi:putative hydrolase of the HAD superfamily
MSLLNFKALTIDVVGTLIDCERGILDYLHAVVPHARVSDDEFLAAYRDARASPLARPFPDDLERVWQVLGNQFELPHEAACGFRASVAYWPAFADAEQSLQRLHRHFQLVAATDTQRWALGCFEHTLGMPFDFTLTREDTRYEKPDPRYFVALRDLLARHGITRADTLHVGHCQFRDIRVAQALDWRTCWIDRHARRWSCGVCWPVDKPVRADWRFATLRELADAVDDELAESRLRMALPLFADACA